MRFLVLQRSEVPFLEKPQFRKSQLSFKKKEYLINSISDNNLLTTYNTPLTSLRKELVMDTIINMDIKVTFKKLQFLRN